MHPRPPRHIPHIPFNPALGDPDPLQIEVTCLHCGYNLRGLVRFGACPECGTPILHTLRGDSLQYSDPAWVEKLGLAMQLMCANLLVTFLATFFAHRSLSAIIYFVALAVQMVACWLLTEQEPRVAISEKSVSLRRLLRACALLSLGGGVLSLAGYALPAEPLIWIGAILQVFSAPCAFLFFWHVGHLAWRIPNESLALQCHTVRWGYAVTLGILMLSGLFLLVSHDRFTAMFAACPALAGGAIFGLWAIILMIRLWLAFAEAAQRARNNTAVPAAIDD